MEILRKLEHLTPEEKALVDEIKHTWLEKMHKKPRLDKEKAKEFVYWLYNRSGANKPKIVFVDSTGAGQYIARYLDRKVWFKRLRNEKNLQKKCDKFIKKNGIPHLDSNFYNFSDYGNVGDFGWMAFYDFMEKINVIKNPEYQEYNERFTESGIFDMIQFDKVCIVCSYPIQLKLDEMGRLHGEDCPAVEWKDGFKKFLWKGVKVNPNIILYPETITKQDIARETNAEIRRVIHEKLGHRKFAELLGVVEIDRDVDHQGNEQILFETEEVDSIAGEKIKFAQVTCPTSNRIYFIPVPPEMTDILRAKAWTFYRTKETFNPRIET